MRLVFSILWFDDNVDWYESIDKESLIKKIESWGFVPQLTYVDNPKDFQEHAPFEAIDLVIIDRNLEDSKEGGEFIEQIRGHGVYTEVIFYTAGEMSALWESITEKRLEGVYVTDRGSLLSKIEVVGEQSIKKVLDLDNMRGIVMAEVGELDHLLDKIIACALEKSTEEQQSAFYKRFIESLREKHNDNVERVNQFEVAPTLDTMFPLCDSNKRWANFNRLRRFHTKVMTKESIGDYVQEVLNPRNYLAHGIPEIVDGIIVFKFGDKEFDFSEDSSLELRRIILKYKQAFDEIIDEFSNN